MRALLSLSMHGDGEKEYALRRTECRTEQRQA